VAQKVTLKVSAAAAAYVRPETAKEEKLKAARGEIPLSPADLGMVLFLLSRDQDPDLKNAAVTSLGDMPDSMLIPLASAPDTHPLLLDMLARVHIANEKLVETLFAHPGLDIRTRQFLADRLAAVPTGGLPGAGPDDGAAETDEHPAGQGEQPSPGEDEEDLEEESYSKYKLLQNMSINE
jgi:hypothetical protein